MTVNQIFNKNVPEDLVLLLLSQLNINNFSDEKKVEFFSDFSQLKFLKVVSLKKVRTNDRVKK